MFGRRKRIEAITQQNKTLTLSLGILMEDLQEYAMFEHLKKSSYTSKTAQVDEIHRKYKGVANFGNQISQRIINLRVAFSVPNRLFLVKNPNTKVSDSGIKKVKEFLNDFMSLTGLNSSIPRDLCKESELEGQVAIRLVWDAKEKLPRIKYYPNSEIRYEIKAKKQYVVNSPLFMKFTGSERTRKRKGSEIIEDWNSDPEVLKDDDFVFISFNEKLNSYDGYPTLGGILTTIENMDKDLIDWRKLNHLFAHPTPHFKCETEEQALAINDMIRKVGWKVGTALATDSEFTLKGPSGGESQMLMLSIQTSAKIVSAHTGIGIHFLGFANVMSNRATADSMGEPTEVVLHSEIASWQSFYIQLFRKAIRLRNKHLHQAIDEDAVLPKLMPLTDRQWQVIKDIFMPAKEAGLISLETFLEHIPDIDSAAEQERLEAEEKKRDEKRKKDGRGNGLQQDSRGQVVPIASGQEPGVPRVPGSENPVGERRENFRQNAAGA